MNNFNTFFNARFDPCTLIYFNYFIKYLNKVRIDNIETCTFKIKYQLYNQKVKLLIYISIFNII